VSPEVQASSGSPPEDPTEETTAEKGVELPLFTTRRLIQTGVLVFVLLVAIYFLFPKLIGLSDGLSVLGEADPLWIGVAIGFNVVAFGTYIALFKAVVGGNALRLRWVETYEINMAGLAATLLFSAGGAGGIVLTYWALRKAGMKRRDVARRIAHEIKNPLTPIQLSAERIRRKYRASITNDVETFDRCTDTIIRQVGDIGRMVDE